MTHASTSAESVFIAAIQISDEAERNSFLDRECGAGGSMREEVSRLLERHLAEEEFLVETRKARRSRQALGSSERVGEQIGPYKLLQQIGEGGMGVVFMAEQESPIRRRVALKVIKSGMDTKEVLARFEAERQAMAIMDHPNIAKALDAGQTEEGRPYFVMELVMGTPITTFCNERKLTPGQRLELFIPVCRAIQHAHQKGVIHRDLKPSNVLVAHYDEQIVPKVIDFGLAKALHQALTEKTVFTRFGQLVGTWEYMSPEQAKLNQLDVDTRSDVYSLGVLLYELLTGQTPFDRRTLKEAGLEEVLRVIREVEPPQPTQRLRHSGTLASAATNCRTESRQLDALLRGDLCVVVMKSLEKDRNRRYEAASALADDIQRYLVDAPVAAAPPSTFYRTRRFLRRNRGAVAIACCLLLVALGAGVWRVREAILSGRLAVAEAYRGRRTYAEDMSAAYRAWEDGRIAVARSLLAKHVPEDDEADLRGFEWGHIKRLCDASAPEQYTDDHAWGDEYSFAPRSSTFFPGGNPFVAAVLNHGRQSLLIWDATRDLREPPWQYPTPFDSQIVAYSPDGRFVAFFTNAATETGSARAFEIRELESGVSVLSYDMERDLQDVGFLVDDGDLWGKTEQVVFSSDATRLAVRSNQYAVMVWEWSPSHEPSLLWKHAPDEGERDAPFRPTAQGFAFSPDGAALAIARSQNVVSLVDSETGRDRRDLRLSAPCGAQAFSPDGRDLITATKFGEAVVWDVETGEEIGFWNEPGFVSDLCLSPDGRRVAVSAGPLVRIRDTRSRRVLQEFRGHENATVHFSPSGDELLVADDQGLKRWRVDAFVSSAPDAGAGFYDKSPAHIVLRGHEANLHMLSFHPSGRWLASAGGSDRSFRVWDLEQRTGEELEFPFKERGNAWSAVFSGDGNTLVTGGFDDWGIRYWKWPYKRLLTPERIGGGMAVLSPNGRWYAATGSVGHFVRDLQSHDALGELTNREKVGVDYFGGRGAFSPVAPLFAAASNSGHVELLNVESGEIVWSKRILNRRRQSHMAAFSPDGSLIAVGWHGEPTIHLVQAKDGESAGRLPGHSGASGYAVAFSPDGRTLASTGSDGALRLWDVATREQRFVFQDEGLGFNSVAFSPDGHTLAVGHGPEIWLLQADARGSD